MTNHAVAQFKRLLEGYSDSSVSSLDLDSQSSLVLRFDGAAFVPLSVICQSLEELAELSTQQADSAWPTLGWAALSLYGHVVNHLVAQTLPISSSILYWDGVLDAGPSGLALYGFQQLPAWAYAQSRAVLLGHHRLTLAHIPFKSMRPRSVMEVLYMANPAYVYVKSAIKRNRAQLVAIRDHAAERLGALVSQSTEDITTPDAASLKAYVVNCVNLLHTQIVSDLQDPSTAPADAVASGPQSVAAAMLQVARALPADRARYSAVLSTYGRPGIITRYWPVGLVGLVGLYKVLGNWSAIVDWFQTQLVDRAVAFWQNWVVHPFLQVWETIRYDETAQISLTTKQSLQSDMDSLERMVLDFARSSGSVAVAGLDDDALRAQVRQGDISAVLLSYENDIKSPLSSVVRGQLVRSLLIQIQKAKVDAEVAMSGVDKLLQSQQLVFSLVAALPAMAVSWWAGNAFVGRTLSGSVARRVRGQSQVKREIAKCLGNIKSILRSPDYTTGQHLTSLGLGLVMCETSLLRSLGQQIITPGRVQEWHSDLDQIEMAPASIPDRLQAMQLIYVSHYF